MCGVLRLVKWLCILRAPVLNLSPETDHYDEGLRCFPSISPYIRLCRFVFNSPTSYCGGSEFLMSNRRQGIVVQICTYVFTYNIAGHPLVYKHKILQEMFLSFYALPISSFENIKPFDIVQLMKLHQGKSRIKLQSPIYPSSIIFDYRLINVKILV